MFWEWPSDKFVRHIEGRGHGLRKRLGLKESAALDPKHLVGTYENMDLLDLGQVVDHLAELEVLKRNSGAWSAMAYRENGGVWLITWNPCVPARNLAGKSSRIPVVELPWTCEWAARFPFPFPAGC